MTKAILRVVLDTCYIIERLQCEPEDESEVAKSLTHLEDDMRHRRVDVFASDAMLKEVMRGHKKHKRKEEEVIAGLRHAGMDVLSSDDPSLQQIAENLRAELNVGRMDSIHLATAIYYQANRLYTTDKSLQKSQARLVHLAQYSIPDGFEICEIPTQLFPPEREE